MSLRQFIKRTQLLLEEALYESRQAMKTHDDSVLRPVEVTQLEERILMSASPLAVVADAADSAPALVDSAEAPAAFDSQALTGQQLLDIVADDVLPASSSQQSAQEIADDSDVTQQTLELVFIDGSISNLDQMIADLTSESDLDQTRSLEIVVLDPERDGIAQITAALIQYNGIDGIHIVSHGSDGQVQLGSTTLSLDNLDRYLTAISAWQHSMSEEADILIYGCNVAESANGQELLNQLSELTATDVAASEDLTGHADLGGDYDLEFQIGDLESDIVFSDQFIGSYYATLDITSNLVAHYEFEENTGSTATDSTANNIDGTLINTPSWSSDVSVGSFSLDFTGDAVNNNEFVSVPVDPSLDFSGDFSVSFWYNSSVAQANNTRIIGSHDGSDGFSIFANANGTLSFFAQGSAASTTTTRSGGFINDGTWHHVVAVKSADSIRLYVNETTTGAAGVVFGAIDPAAPLTIGGESTTIGDYEGKLDDIRVYSRALSASDVSEAYALGAARTSYLASNGANNTFEHISNVTFAGINNSTGTEAGGYGDYTGQTATAIAGSTNSLSVTINPDSLNYVTAWVDWNQDFDFNDPGEGYLIATNVSTPGPHTVNIAAPSDAVVGDTRMRVSLVYNETPNSFGTFGYGEVEDYTITVQAAQFNVDTTADTVDGTTTDVATLLANRGADGFISLREAILAVNNDSGTNWTISLAAGTYNFASGTGDTAGDFDIRNNMTLVGAGIGNTIIDANQIERVFEVFSGVVTFEEMTIQDGYGSAVGSAINVNTGANVTLDRVRLFNNQTTTADGGAIFNAGALTVLDSEFDSNLVASGAGGAIRSTGTLDIQRTTFGSNSTGGGLGGAIFQSSNATTTITDSLFVGNSSQANIGGAIYGAGNLTITNTTFSGNSTPGSYTGSAIYIANGTTSLQNVTVTDNTHGGNGAVRVASTGTLDIRNTIIAGNSGGGVDDLSSAGTINDLGNNLIGDGAGQSALVDGVNGNQVGASGGLLDPLLGALANNGGPTLTHALLAGSTAIDAGNNTSAPSTDQRAGLRDATTDIGAYESNAIMPGSPSDLLTGSTSDGGLSINDDGGDNTYLIADNSGGLLGGLSSFTYEVQFSSTDATGNLPLLSYNSSSTDNVLQLYITSDGRLVFRVNDAAVISTAIDYLALSDGEQHSIAATWDNTAGDWGIYVDGQLESSGTNFRTGYTLDAGGALVLGQEQDSLEGDFQNTQAFHGTLYDARFFNDVRTASEIASSYLSDLQYDEAGMIANWKFDQLSSDGIVLETVSGNNLTVKHIGGTGFTSSQPTQTFALDENALDGTVVGQVSGVDAERDAQIASLLTADSELRYSAETGKFYKGVSTTGLWSSARTAAEGTALNGVNGQLVTIRSAFENEFVREIADNDVGNDVWIGATDSTVEGEWRWVDGGAEAELFWDGDENGYAPNGAYHNFQAGQPNDAGSNEDVVRLDDATGQWLDADHDNHNFYGYVIEWDADAVLDATQALTYVIQSQTVAGAFAIDGSTGQITVADGSLLDFETDATHTVTVRVSDSEATPNTYDEAFTISLNDLVESNNAPTDLSSGIELNSDGGNDAYLIADDGGAILGGMSSFTLELSYAISENATGENALLSYATLSEDNEVYVRISPAGTLSLAIQGVQINSPSIPDLVDGDLHSISISWDNLNGDVSFYIDGELHHVASGLGTGVTLNTGGNLLFGQDQDSVGGGFNSTQRFSGSLYDVRIWNEVRSEAEIALNHQHKFDSGSLPGGLVANWQMAGFDGSNQVVDVVSGNNLAIGHATGTGTFTNSTPVGDLHVLENATNGTSVGYVVLEADSVEDIVSGGSFLDATVASGQTGTIGAWTVDSGNVDVTLYEAGPLGGQAIDLSGTTAGTISQSLVTEEGRQYQVIFALSGNWNGDSNSKTVRVAAGGESDDFSVARPTGWSSSNMLWNQRSMTFTADSTTTELSFASLEPGNAGPMITDVQVFEIPQAVSTILNNDPTLSYDAATGKFYRFVSTITQPLDAINAATSATLNGVTGQLATIRSAYENELIRDFAREVGGDLLIGGRDATTEGDWYFLDGNAESEQFSTGSTAEAGYYTNWRSAEPNGSTGENQLAIGTDGQWLDVPDNEGRRYVIEWDASEVLSSFTFSLTDDASGRFAIDSSTGEITVADGSLLDYETATSHNVTVQVTDAAGNSYSEAMSIAIDNEIEAIQTVPEAQTIDEDGTPLTFVSGTSTEVSVRDSFDTTDSRMRVTLSVNDGILNLSGFSGITFVEGASGSGSLIIDGTESNINAALNNMTFTPDANFNGSVTLNMTTSLQADLDGRYEFEGNADDTSNGTSNNGTLVGATTTPDATRGGDVLLLDAAGEHVEITGRFNTPANVTLAAWINLDAGIANAEVISLGHNLILRADNGGNQLSFGWYQGGGVWNELLDATINLDGAGWNHVAATFDDTNDTVTLYLNGQEVASLNTADSIDWTDDTNTTSNTYIGTHGNGTPGFDFQGRIDDARIYTRALSADEITALAADQTEASDTVAITVTAVNDAPTFGNLDGNPTFIEGGAAVVLDADVQIFDAELSDANDFGGASMSLFRNGGSNPEDVFSASGNLVFDTGDVLRLSGTAIGSYANSGNGFLLLNFAASTTNAQVNETLQSIAYSNTSDNPPSSVQLNWTFTDGNFSSQQGSGGNGIGSGSTTVNITAVNDAPAAIADSDTATEAGGTANATTGTDPTGNVLTNDTDADSDDTKTVVGVQAGTQVSTSGSVSSSVAGSYGSITINSDGSYTYTVDNNNAEVQALRNSSDTLTDTFSYTMEDASGAESTAQITLTVEGANDAPDAIVPATFLSTLTPTDEASLQGGLKNDTNFGEVADIVLDGVTYPRGLTTHPISGLVGHVEYDINGATSFKATIGNRQPGSVDMRVYVDGVLAHSSSSLSSSDSPIDINIDVTGATTLRLEVDDAGDNQANDHATWANARFEGGSVGLSVDENAANDTIVGSVNRNDVDWGDNATYTLINDAGGRFAIDSATGEITVADGTKLDHEATDSHTVTIRAADVDGATYDQNLVISIGDVNEAPTFNNLDATPTYVEGESHVVMDSDVTVVDPELSASNNFGGSTLALSRVGGPDSQDQFSTSGIVTTSNPVVLVNGSPVGTYTHSGGEMVVTFDAGATAADVNAVAQTTRYGNTSNTPPSSAQVQWVFNDGNTGDQGSGGALETTGNITVNITAVNDDPVLTHAPDGGTYSENGAGTFVDVSTTVTDVDSLNFDGGVLTTSITGNGEAADRLIVRHEGIGAGQVNVVASTIQIDGVQIATIGGGVGAGDDLLITFNANADATDVEKVARRIAFRSVSENPSTAQRTISTTLTDGDGGTSATDTRVMNVIASNDDPTNPGGIPVDVTVTEDVLTSVDLSGVDFSDVDAGSSDLTVTLSTSTGGELTLAADANITFGGTASARTLTGTLAELNAYFNNTTNIQYLHGTPNTFGDNADTITVVINDNGNSGNGGGTDQTLGSANVDITAINDAPVLTATGTNPTYIENDALADLFASVSLAPVESGQQINQLVYTVTNVADGGDEQISFDGTFFSLSDGTTGTTANQGYGYSVSLSGNTATITLGTSGQSISSVRSDIDTTRYRHLSDNPTGGDRVVTITSVTDDGGGTDTANPNISSTVTVVPVNDDPTNAGSLPSDITVTEDVLNNVDLSAVHFSDVDANGSDLIVTLTTSTGGELTLAADGNLTFGGTATVRTMTGSLADLNAYFNTASNVQYIHGTANTFGNDADTINVVINDDGNTGSGGGTDQNLGTVNVDITAINDAPELDNSGTMTLATITEDDTNNAGQTVASIIASAGGDRITDLDSAALEGIAIVNSSSSNIVRQYSINGGSTWNFFGTPSNTSSILLRSTDLVRIDTTTNNGSTGDAFFFRAWDQTTGNAGDRVDTSSNGGATAFSTDIETVAYTITSVNDAPVLDNSGNLTLDAQAEDAGAPSGIVGTVITDLVSIGGNVTDVDASSQTGIAITAAETANGTWWYTIDSGTTWNALGSVSESSARVLSANSSTRVYFQSNSDFNGTVNGAITFRAWDRSFGANGSLQDASTTGGTTAFSTATESANITITPVNDAPTLTNGFVVNLAGTDEDTPSSGSIVSAIFASAGGNDVDAGSLSGIAVTSVTGSNTWQYSTDGTNWTDFGSVANNSALMLTSTTQVRYNPDGIDGETASFAFIGWDQTVSSGSTFGSPGLVDPSGNQGGTNEFSAESASVSLTVSSVNDPVVAVADTGSATEAGGVANADVGRNATGNVLANDTESDPGDTLNVIGIAAGTVSSASTNVATSVTGTYGAITIDADGGYTYIIDENNSVVQGLRTLSDSVSDTFTYTVQDSGSATSSTQVVITITGQNDDPIAVNDTAIAVEAGGIANANAGTNPTGNVLTNDTDVDAGDTKTVIGTVVGSSSGAVGTSVNGTYGAITINSNGSFTYTVDNSNAAVEALRTSGDTLNDAFTYTMTDTDGATSTASITVTIQGQNDDPVAVNDSLTAVESGGVSNATTGSNGTGNVLTNDTDKDTSDTQTIIGVNSGSQASASGNVNSAVTGSYGSLTIDATGNATFVVDENNSAVQALRTVSDTLTEVFTYTMQDAAGANSTAEVTITITGQNDAPTAVANSATAIEASGINNNISGTDPTGNVLTNDLDVDAADTKTVVGVDTGTQASTSGNVGTTLAASYGDIVINSDGSYTYTLDNDNATVEGLLDGESLTETFSYTMQDNVGLQSTTQIVITIDGRTDLPVAVADMDTSEEAGGVANTTPGINPSGNVLANDSTNDGKTVIGVDPGVTSTANGDVGTTVVGTYGSVVIDANGDFTYTLDNTNADVEALRTSGEHVTDVFTYTMEDNASNTSTTQLTITVDGNNDTIIAIVDAGTAVEAGGLNNGTAGSDATGNVINNDTDVDSGDTKLVTGVQLGTQTTTSGSVGASVAGNYGNIVINNDGSYTYAINESLAAIQALRTTSDTLTETYSYTVTDTAGASDTTQIVITIQGGNDTPTAVVDTATAFEAGGVNNGNAGTNPTGNVVANDTDVDSGDTKTVVGVEAGTQANATGNVNAAVVGNYGSITIASDGSYTYAVDNANATVQGLRTSGQSVTDTFTYTVADTGGLQSTTQITVTVRGANDSIVAVADTMTATEAGGTANSTAGNNPTTNVLTNDTDVDADDTKTVSGVAAGNAGSASGSVGASVAGLYGTIQIASDGSATYTVDNSNSAVQDLLNTSDTLTDVFSYTVQDIDGAESTTQVTVTIEGANDAPVAIADSGTADESGGVSNATTGNNATGNVLTNDNQVDVGDTHTVTGVATGTQSTTSGNVGSGVTGTYGTLTVNTNGSFTYIVDETNVDVEGLRTTSNTLSEVFSYTTEDAGGLSSTTTITLTIRGANDNPVANFDTATAVEAGGLANATAGTNPTGNVLTNDTDIDNGDSQTVTGNVVGAVSGAVGTSVAGEYGSITINNDGSYTYVVNNNSAAVEALRTFSDTLDDVFSYTVTDAGGLTDTSQITITIQGQNDAPVAQAGTLSATEDGGSIGGTLINIDADAGETHSYTLITNTTEGTTTVNANGTYSFDPGAAFQDLAAGETRNVTFTYQVEDIAGANSQADVTITVTGTNDAPVFSIEVGDSATATLNETNTTLTSTGTLTLSDSDLTNVTTTAVTSVTTGGTTDGLGSDNAALLAMFSSTTNVLDANETTDQLTWGFDSASETFDYLGVGESLTLTYTIAATDSHGATDTQNVTITINATNDLPVISNLGGDILNYSEGGGAQIIDQSTNAAVTDVDSDNFFGGTLTVSFIAGSDSGEDVLAIANTGTAPGQIGLSGSNVTYGGVTIGTFTGGSAGSNLVITLTANADAVATTTLVQSISYENIDTDNPTSGNRTVRYVLTDGDSGISANYDTTVSVASVNDAPVLPNGATMTLSEGGGVAPLFSSVFSDVDTVNFDGGVLTAAFASGSDGTEQLYFASSAHLSVSGTDLTYDGLKIADISGFGTDGPLVVSFNSNATTTEVQETFRNVSVRILDDNPTSDQRVMEVTLTDGDGGTSNVSTSLINVQPVNDAPVNTVPGTQTIVEETQTAITGISIADIDANGLTVTTRVQVNNGILDVTLAGSAAISTGSNSSSDLTLSGTVADINATLASLLYTPDVNITGINADTLTVTTNDGGNTGSGGALQDVDTVQIDITNVNDEQVLSTNTGITVNEGDVGSVITQAMLETTDVDHSAAEVVYRMNTLPSTGTLRLNGTAITALLTPFTQQDINDGRLTYDHNGSEVFADSFAFTVDDGTGLTSSGSFNITITPVNDNAPIITSDGGPADAAITLEENITAVTTVTATDADLPTQTLTFSIAGGPDSGLFTIDGGTGALAFATAPSFETRLDADNNNVYEIIVEVNDGQGLTSQQTVRITVTDVDEFDVTSIIDNDAAANNINENVAVGTVVGITAFSEDLDGTNNAVSYSLDDNAGGLFSIDSLTGIVTTAAPIDFEAAGNALNITVRATSADESTATQDYTITINDLDEFDLTPVVDTDDAADNINENTPVGTAVGITAFSEDLDGTTNAITYSLDNNAGGLVSINATTGLVSTAAAINYETVGSTLNVVVRATSQDGSTATQAYTITVNDLDEFDVTPIVDTNAATNVIDENVAVGTAVGITAFSQDQDGTTNTVSYSLDDNAGGLFNIDGSTGVVTTAAAIDFEAVGGSLDITVRATSADGSSTIVNQTITVNDLNDNVPVITPGQEFSVSEFSSTGTTIGIVTATDSDTVGTLNNWTITAGNSDAVFAINPVTGELTIADASSINFETTPGYTLTVTVSDGTATSTPQTISIVIQNENDAPVLAPAAFSIVENSTNGSILGTVTAADEDTGDILTYSLTGPSGNPFAIDSGTGLVSVNDVSQLNFEATTSFTIDVQVQDASGLTDTQSIVVTIVDVNETPVDISLSASFVNENSANGTLVGTAIGIDVDAGDLLTYSLIDDAAGRFTIDAVNGQVRVADSSLLDFESSNTHSIAVRATDSDSLFVERSFEITVGNVNEAPTALDDSFSGAQLETIVAELPGITSNDFDIDGDGISVILVSGPSDGTLILQADGTFVYTPNGVFSGIDTFQYVVSDGVLISNQATVQISIRTTVTNNPSEIVPVIETVTPIESETPTEETEQTQESENDKTEAVETSTTTRAAMSPQGNTEENADQQAFLDTHASNEAIRSSTSEVFVSVNIDDIPELDSKASKERQLRRTLDGDGLRSSAGVSDFLFSPVQTQNPFVHSTQFAIKDTPFLEQQAQKTFGDIVFEKVVVGSSAAVSTSVSVGYAVWMLRGGSLLTSVLSSLPVWQGLDPLAVLESFEDETGEGEDEETLASLVS